METSIQHPKFCQVCRGPWPDHESWCPVLTGAPVPGSGAAQLDKAHEKMQLAAFIGSRLKTGRVESIGEQFTLIVELEFLLYDTLREICAYLDQYENRAAETGGIIRQVERSQASPDAQD